jgi:hypothetical protein
MFKEWRINKIRSVITSTGDRKKVRLLASMLRVKPEDYVIEWNKDDLQDIVMDFFYSYEVEEQSLTTDNEIYRLKNFCTPKDRKIRLINGIVNWVAYQPGGSGAIDYAGIEFLLQILKLEKSDLDYDWIKTEFEAGEKYLEQMDAAADEAIAIATDAEYQGWRAERQFEGLPDSIHDYQAWIQEQEELDELLSMPTTNTLH